MGGSWNRYKEKTKVNQIIMHVDMDAFFASVEIRDNPSLLKKPLIIGALPNERGVVATCSYEARKFGIRSAMNIKDAYRLCPKGIFMHPNYEKYKLVSKQLHKIWCTYAKNLEAIALDEAYLDITKVAKNFEGAYGIAQIIKSRTYEELGLTCSIGVAYSKTAAKVASEEKKPNGYFEIRNIQDYVNLIVDRDVKILYSVGTKTAERLNRAGIHTVSDVQCKQDVVIDLLGNHGKMVVELALGIDNRKVVTNKPQDAKSIGREITFQENVESYEFLMDVLLLLSLCVKNRAERMGLHGNGVTLKITFANMKSITRSKIIYSSDCTFKIYQETRNMLLQIPKQSIRLIGISIYNLSREEKRQLCFTDILEKQNHEQENKLVSELKRLHDRYKLDFAGHLTQIYQMDVLHKTVEYMRKHYVAKT